MKIGLKKKVTLMLDEKVYAGLRARVGSRGVGAYLSQLAKPFVDTDDLEAGYEGLANDAKQRSDTADWLTAEVSLTEENKWQF